MVVPTTAKFARPLGKMQSVIFPTLTENELLREEHYLHHMELFPQGQFTALVHHGDKWTVAGSTVTFRVKWSFFEKPHTFAEAVSDGWMDNHDPDGEWLYPQGLDWDLHDYEHTHYWAALATQYNHPVAALLEDRRRR